MIGDDVVDLRDPAIETHHRRERFLDRVLTAGERAVFEAALSLSEDAAKALLWSFFAGKEAAYKVVSKSGPPPVFAHRKFVVAEDLRSVRYEERVLDLDVEVTADCVHAIARGARGEGGEGGEGGDESRARFLDHGVGFVPPDADPSLAARSLLRDAAARRLGCSPDSLAIHRPPRAGSWDGFGPPRLVRLEGAEAVALDVDVSLSHDGRFVSFALEA